MERPLLRLIPDSNGTTFFLLAVLLVGGFFAWSFSFWTLFAFVITLVICWYLVLRTYIFVEFYEAHVLLKRNFDRIVVRLTYSDIEAGKYYFSQGNGNILFQLKFYRNSLNVKTASYSQAGIEQFQKIAKLLLEKGVPFYVIPTEKTNKFFGYTNN